MIVSLVLFISLCIPVVVMSTLGEKKKGDVSESSCHEEMVRLAGSCLFFTDSSKVRSVPPFGHSSRQSILLADLYI